MFSPVHPRSLGFSSIAALQVSSICMWMSPHDSQVKLHHSFQVVCPVPQYLLYLSPFFCPGGEGCDQCSVMSRPHCSSYLCFRSLTVIYLLPYGAIWVWGSCSLWNLLTAWSLLNSWPNLGNSDFHPIAPSMFWVPWGRMQEELLNNSHLSIHSLSEGAKQGTCIYLGPMCKDCPLHSTRA